MVGGSVRMTSVWQQTIALLWKNLLLKWRRKWHSILEWLQDLAYVLLMFLVAASAQVSPMNEFSPYAALGRVDSFTSQNFTVGYISTAPTARETMRRVAESQDLPGWTVQEFEDEEALLSEVKNHTAIAVIFHHPFQYHIRFSVYNISSPNDYTSYQGVCSNISENCYPTFYWSTGFLFLQAKIDSAIIEMTTSHMVQEQLTSIMVGRMASTQYSHSLVISVGIFVFGMCLSYVSMMYLLSLYVTRERMEMGTIMKTMRLKERAFWLSWGLLYLIYVIIIANLMTLVTGFFVFTRSSYGVILLLFILYGIASICVTFMLSALFRNPRVTAIAGFFITLLTSASGLLLLMKNLPKAVEVLLCIFPPFAFSVGLVESVHMEDDLRGVFFSHLTDVSSHIVFCCISLMVDSLLYGLLTLYFSKVLPDKNGMRYEALFFLRSSYWSREKDFPPKFPTRGRAESRNEENIEKVPCTFQGREVIRIHNVKKTYRGEEKVEALRGLDFDIYEGQITALLGHSGAGKTTLLNILSGMCSPTTGSAFIYNYNLSDMNHLEQIHNMVGFCPQFDVKFDPLTVKENLKVFAHIKGVTSGSADQEVQKVICDLQLTDVQNTEASELSGGQKRKLSLGIAILGDPLVLLLDEPTAGLDPCSRHHVWAKLKERKGDRVTVLSTQFMDEADILADQKAVISSGRLKCMGSSLFLKRKWGIGYHLRMLVSPSCDPKVIMSLVQQHVPSAKLSAKREQEMTFTLPFQNMDAFPDLFSHLDGLVGGDILSYGVAMTTLDDVFLKLEGEAEIEGGDYEVFSQEIMSEQDRDNLNSEMEDSVQLMSDSGKATVSGMALWSQQVMAIARIRFLKLKYDMKSFRALLLLIFLFLIPLITLFTIILNIKGSFMWELRPDLYFLRPGDRGHRYFSSLVINNNTGSPIEDFIVAVKAQDIVVEVIDGPYDTNMTTYKGAIEISGKDQDYRFTIVGNPRAHNALPVLVNIISNSLLKSFQSNERIQTWSNPVRQGDTEYIYIFFMSLVFMAFGSGMAPHFAMSSIEDTRNKARSLLRISGLYPSTYWCGQALVDVPLHCFLLFLMIAILFTFNHKILLDYWVASLLIIGVLGYSAAIVLYVYVISFLFRRGKSHHDLWSFFFIMPTFIPLFMMEFVDLGPTISFLYMFFFPPNALIGLLFSIGGVEINKLHKEDELSSDLHLCVLVSFVHLFLFWGILWFLEWRYGTRSLTRDPVFRTIRRKVMIKPNPEDVADAEEEVLAEREMVKHAKASKHLEATPAIIVDSLRKEFKIKSGVFSFKKKKRVAIKNISFCVKKGEVLGLLGPNGAGKTTSIFTLAGDITATAGEVVLCDASEGSTTFLGYCCQDNPLWPDITVKEHLEIYAAVKGMKKNDGALAIRRVSEALELKEYLNKPAKKLSAGVSRKLCFAISMLGNPTIVLLDEPSTGLDPNGQQRLWRAIRAAFKNKERGAILTTHYMEEAEVVCDRVAIMVSGKLRYIGTIQQLKSKFGKGYYLEIKMKDSQTVDVVHQEITRLFPDAARQDRFSTFLVYKIPMGNVKSLSQAFLHLEEAKRMFSIDEYSFSQSTLEQVFLELMKEQEMEDIDTTFRWTQMPTENM